MRQNAFSYQELLDCANGNLFGKGNAQFPAPPMLMFDRVTNINETGGLFEKGEIVAELDIKPELWFFDCHFKGRPSNAWMFRTWMLCGNLLVFTLVG